MRMSRNKGKERIEVDGMAILWRSKCTDDDALHSNITFGWLFTYATRASLNQDPRSLKLNNTYKAKPSPSFEFKNVSLRSSTSFDSSPSIWLKCSESQEIVRKMQY